MINDHNPAQKMQGYQEYIQALEEERRKIQVFQRELPLCLELVTQAIEGYKQQVCGGRSCDGNGYNFNGQSECSEQTSSEVPVLEEFIPIKRASSTDNNDEIEDEDEDEEESHKNMEINNTTSNKSDKASKKSDWLRSVQLWNQTPDPITKEESPRKVEMNKNGSGGAFHPFRKEKNSVEVAIVRDVPTAAASSTAETGGSSSRSKKEEKESQSNRKTRRCWSPELHKRFLAALHQLGGSHVATPKQIRELMKVDGLTNDEVKSHLQKYRLHTRRPSPAMQNNTQQTPQFVVVGGIWVPPPEYTAVATTTTTASGGGEAQGVAAANPKGVYAPIATLPKPVQDASATLKSRQYQQTHSNGRGCGNSDGGVHSSSPASSSSTHTTTASPAY